MCWEWITAVPQKNLSLQGHGKICARTSVQVASGCEHPGSLLGGGASSDSMPRGLQSRKPEE